MRNLALPRIKDPLTSTRSPSMLRRCFGMALAVTAALTTTVQAQTGEGTIYFRSGTAAYRVAGNGTGLAAIANPPAPLRTRQPSARSDYPGGRLLFYPVERGQIPSLAASGQTVYYGDLFAWSEGGVNRKLTDFGGPEYVLNRFNYLNVWSNDGLDSSFTFVAYDEATALYRVYRAHVSGEDISNSLTPLAPLMPGDSRLELVLTMPLNPLNLVWDWSGTKLHYIDTAVVAGVAHYRIRTHVVGPDVTQSNDPVLLDAGTPSKGGTVKSLSYLDASPTDDLLVANVYDNGRGGTSGLILVDANTGTWSWRLTDAAASTSGISSPFGARFSPDGTGLAFAASRTVKRLSSVPGLYRMPTGSGEFSPVTELPNDGQDKTYIGWQW